MDGEGDTLTFQLTSTPARGAVTLAEDGSSQFVYTPYENKTGSDRFTYVAIDSAGNTSPEATVELRIDKPDTKVTYADMDGNPAQKAAIRLAEEGVYVGRYVDGNYFFDPDQPVTRAQFLTMAMSVTGLEQLEGVTLTGFSDDTAIPAWAKGSVSAALKAGAISGTRDETGAHSSARAEHHRGEASVMLNNLLDITDVPLAVFSSGTEGHWAAQAAANLSASGVVGPPVHGDGSALRPAHPGPGRRDAGRSAGYDGQPGERLVYLLNQKKRHSRFFEQDYTECGPRFPGKSRLTFREKCHFRGTRPRK